MDEKISQIVAEKRPVQGEQGQYGYVRQPEEKPKRARKRRAKNDHATVNDDDDPTNQTAEGLAQLSALPVSEVPSIEQPNIGLPDPSQLPAFQPMPMLHGFPPIPPPHVSLSLPPDARLAPSSGGPDEEEMDDNEESQWIVRVGNEPPPTWAKRKADDNPEQVNPNKRHKSM